MLSEQAVQTCREALVAMRHSARVSTIFAQNEDEFAKVKQEAIAIEERCDAALAELDAPAQAVASLDMPDSPGWWAFEGRGQDDDTDFRTVNSVFDSCGKLWSFRDGECKSVNYWTGKWTRLHMPWEANNV